MHKQQQKCDLQVW